MVGAGEEEPCEDIIEVEKVVRESVELGPPAEDVLVEEALADAAEPVAEVPPVVSVN